MVKHKEFRRKYHGENITTKNLLIVNLRSHALNTTKSRQKPNLQTVTIDGVKVKLTAREIRTLKAA